MGITKTWLVAGALLLGAAPAAAQTPPKNNAAIAEALFRDGRASLKAGDAAAACPKFEESYRLDPRIGTLLNLAQCHAAIGRTATAWSEFTTAIAVAAREGQSAREAFATDRARELEAQLSRVTIIHREATPGLTVSLGGRDLEPATLGTALPIDPGEVVVTATAAGRQAWTTTVTVPEGPADLEVIIPALSPAQEEPAVIAPTPAPEAPAPEPVLVGEQADDPGLHPLVWAGIVTTGAGLLVGGVTGGLALSKGGSLDCPNGVCAQEDEGQLDQAHALARVSNVSFIAAGAGAVVGAVGLVLTFTGSDEGRDAVHAQLGPGWVGIRGAF